MKYKLLSVILFVSMLLGLVGCVAPALPAPTATLASTSLPPTQAPTATVQAERPWEAQARAEGGQLMIYTSMNTKDLDTVLAKFKETYPFVTPQYFRDSGEKVLAKGLADTRAGQYSADVFELDAISVNSQVQGELLAPYTSSEDEAYPGHLKDPAGVWTVDRINTMAIAYNTKLVAPNDVPKTWYDLLDPKWQGKMVVESTDIELLGDMANAWGEAKAYAYWEGIEAQKPVVMTGHTELAQALADGKYAISPTVYAYRIEKLKADGQPVEWVRTDPVFAYTTIAGLALNAPHPATAKLFIDWLLSESGQTVIRDLGRIPARPGISSDPPALIEGLDLLYTTTSVTDHYPQFLEKWNNIFGLK